MDSNCTRSIIKAVYKLAVKAVYTAKKTKSSISKEDRDNSLMKSRSFILLLPDLIEFIKNRPRNDGRRNSYQFQCG